MAVSVMLMFIVSWLCVISIKINRVINLDFKHFFFSFLLSFFFFFSLSFSLSIRASCCRELKLPEQELKLPEQGAQAWSSLLEQGTLQGAPCSRSSSSLHAGSKHNERERRKRRKEKRQKKKMIIICTCPTCREQASHAGSKHHDLCFTNNKYN
jgi:hypothetical protein